MDIKTLSDICNYRKETLPSNKCDRMTFISTENMLPNKAGVVISAKCPTSGNVSKYYPGDVLVSNIRPYFKKIYLADKEGTCSNDVLVFFPKREVCTSDFLFCLLSTDAFFAHATKTAKGTKMPRGERSAIMGYQINWVPINEQSGISEPILNVYRKIKLNEKTAKGTKMPRGERSAIMGYQINWVPINEQSGISEPILNVYRKIKLNEKINDNLQKQAEAIYSRLFIDARNCNQVPLKDIANITMGQSPAGHSCSEINDNLQKQAEAIYSRLFIDARNCNQVPLKDIANITMGQSPAGHSCSEKNEGTVFYQGRAEFGFRFPTRRLFTTEPKRMAKVGDILLSVRAPVGDTNVAYEDCCIGRGLSAIESKTGEPSFLLYTLRYLHHQFEVFNAEGTVFGSINKEQLNNFQINLPPKDKIKEFESIVRPMDDLIRMNFKENNLLNELKEKLLLNFFSNK